MARHSAIQVSLPRTAHGTTLIWEVARVDFVNLGRGIHNALPFLGRLHSMLPTFGGGAHDAPHLGLHWRSPCSGARTAAYPRQRCM